MIPSDTSQSIAKPILPNGKSSTKTTSLPKLPVPKLEDSCKRYLRALEGLQDEEEHERTKGVVNEFLSSGEGSKWQKRLEDYAQGVDSYIEEFWCERVESSVLGQMAELGVLDESYLSHSDSVVLSLVRSVAWMRKSS